MVINIVDSALSTDIEDVVTIFGMDSYTSGSSTLIPQISFNYESTSGKLTVFTGQYTDSEKLLSFTFGTNTSADIIKFATTSESTVIQSISVTAIIGAYNAANLTSSDHFTITGTTSALSASQITQSTPTGD